MLIDVAIQHQAEKFKERQEEGAGEKAANEGRQGKEKKRKKATGYKNTRFKSEVMFALLGESYSIVFHDRLCFSSFCFHGSAEELRCKLANTCPHPTFFWGSEGRLEQCASQSIS